MKAKHILTIAAFAIAAFTSCKKTNDNPVETEQEITIQSSKDQAVTDYLLEDANDVLDEATVDNNLMGGRVTNATSTNRTLSCATITVTPLSGFPKTITIDFGTAGCTSPNGVVRSGKIIVTLSDSLRRPGSVATMTFDNYYVQGYKKEGTITWRNTTVPPRRSWERTVTNGKITAPNGRFWLHSGVKNVTQIEGNGTPRILLDDIFEITGNSSVTNSNGVTRTATVITTLRKKVICPNIDRGTIQFVGPNHTVLMDYGNGTCDRQATISVDGGTPVTILLP